MWAAEEGQEELDQEKETEKKEKDKWKQERAHHESKRIHLKGLGAGGPRINAKASAKISPGK